MAAMHNGMGEKAHVHHYNNPNWDVCALQEYGLVMTQYV